MKTAMIALLGILTAGTTSAQDEQASTRLRVLVGKVQSLGEGASKDQQLAAAQAFLAPYRDEIIEAATERDPNARAVALYLLGLVAPDDAVIDALVEGTRDADARIQQMALAGLGANASNLESVDAREAVIAPIAEKRSARVYRAAVMAAAFLRLPEAVPVIAADVASADEQVKSAAIAALRQYGPAAESALPVLRDHLHATRDQETARALADVIRRVEGTR